MWNKRPGWGAGRKECVPRNGRQLSYGSVTKYSRTCDCIVLITKKFVVSGFVQLKSSLPFGLPCFRFPELLPKKKLVTSCCSLPSYTSSPQCDCGSKNRGFRNFVLKCLWESPVVHIVLYSDLSVVVLRTNAFILFPKIIKHTLHEGATR
jgi:hypothetical protein